MVAHGSRLFSLHLPILVAGTHDITNVIVGQQRRRGRGSSGRHVAGDTPHEGCGRRGIQRGVQGSAFRSSFFIESARFRRPSLGQGLARSSRKTFLYPLGILATVVAAAVVVGSGNKTHKEHKEHSQYHIVLRTAVVVGKRCQQ